MSKKASSRMKVAAVEHWVPQNRDEVNTAIDEIGRCQRERVRIETEMNDRMAALKAETEGQAKPIGERIAALSKGVAIWCEANRTVLTQDGKVKFHEFATGQVKWRMRPPSIAVRGAEAVLNTLKAMGFDRFIRTKEEIDKEALLREPEIARGVGGVSISQKEDFVIVPHESQIEEVS